MKVDLAPYKQWLIGGAMSTRSGNSPDGTRDTNRAIKVMASTTFTFPGCWVHIDVEARFLSTVFPDGAMLTSVPMPEKDIETARRYGYGNDWFRLWREHDLLHHWVAVQCGLLHSPTIWSECHNDHPDALARWVRLEEEGFVAGVHRWLNGGGWTPDLWPIASYNQDISALYDEATRVLRHELTEVSMPVAAFAAAR